MGRIWATLVLVGIGHSADVTLSMTDQAVVANPIRFAALAQAARMFATIGVRLEWTTESSRNPNDKLTIQVRFLAETRRHPGAMAYSTPFDPEPVVTINYDRILLATQVSPGMRAAFLAHVLVHEIGHVLMRTDTHSSDGVMKAQWSTRDIRHLAWRPLSFQADEAQMIRQQLGIGRTPAPEPN
jgi:hypothetical protein